MGSLLSCCAEPQNEAQYDRETLRELQAQAAEKRMQENEKRGVKNVESVKRQQERKNQMENMEDNRIGSGSNNLKWQVG